METTYHFMVDFSLPEVLTEEFMNQIPFQRAAVDRFFKEGRLVNYYLSLENSKIWAVFNANSEMAVMDMIADLPLTPFMHVEISMLTFYNSIHQEIHNFSMN